MKKVAILQSNYIPWKGYFDLINSVDEFIFYDSAQYTDRDWRNRNLIKTKAGLKWLTVPVQAPYQEFLPIAEVRIATEAKKWQQKHWKTIVANYAAAPYFKLYSNRFEALYLNFPFQYLGTLNQTLIAEICRILNIETTFKNSSEFKQEGNKSEKLLNMCLQAKTEVYVSGPAAKAYLDEKLFTEAGIKVEWMNYENYPEYQQFYPPFTHNVSILDLLFHTGPNARKFMKS